LGLFHLFWALLSGRFLLSRGAVFPALADLGLPDDAVRRSEAALATGRWKIERLLNAWCQAAGEQSRFLAHCYEGIKPVACDLVGFFRPHLKGCASKHYTSTAGKALPAVVLGMIARVGSVGRRRLALLTELMRPQVGESEPRLQRRLLARLKTLLAKDEAAVVDAGFEIADVLSAGLKRFVVRGPTNFCGRRNYLPEYKGRGAHPKYGNYVRPLARTYQNKTKGGDKPDATQRWKEKRYHIRARIWNDLVLSDAKPGSETFRCVVILDPRYKAPWVLLTDLPLTAEAIWRLYRDRWAIEQIPLAAKQMLGAEQSYVFGEESRLRLPELALLSGNVLSYRAACSQSVCSGFWDRNAQPTCGRFRRALARYHYSDLSLPVGPIRKKASVSDHLPKGVLGHRRTKAPAMLSQGRMAA